MQGLRSYLCVVQFLQSNCNSLVVSMMMSILVIYNFEVGLSRPPQPKGFSSHMNNTRKWDKRKMKSQLSLDKWTYLYLLFPKILVEVFISNYTFYFKKKVVQAKKCYKQLHFNLTIKGNINFKKCFFSLFGHVLKANPNTRLCQVRLSPPSET